ncbi:MAG: Ig-like domain-containing protein [Moraxellaceae bacterium]|nr:Ig-like domain-containing protein [Moraxellaceae bacterium]
MPKDLAGNALVNNASWNFSTGATPDTTRPTVTLLVPSAGATGVAFNTKITATFSEDMNPSSLDETTFTVRAGATPILGSVTCGVGAKTATFTPITPLLYLPVPCLPQQSPQVPKT